MSTSAFILLVFALKNIRFAKKVKKKRLVKLHMKNLKIGLTAV